MISGNGKVDFDEFVALMLELENPELDQQSYLEAFRAFDTNNRGYVQSALIREILLEVMGQRPADRELIIKVFNLDKNRRVSYEGEYISVLTSLILMVHGFLLNFIVFIIIFIFINFSFILP